MGSRWIHSSGVGLVVGGLLSVGSLLLPTVVSAGSFLTVAGGPSEGSYVCNDWHYCETNRVGYVLSAGYHFDRPWGLEAKWIDAGTVDSRVTDGPDTLSHNYVRETGYAVGLVYDSGKTKLPISLRFGIGFAHLTSEIESTTQASPAKQSSSVDVPYVDASFGYDFAAGWTVSMGLIFYNAKDVIGNSVDHVVDLLGVRYEL